MLSRSTSSSKKTVKRTTLLLKAYNDMKYYKLELVKPRGELQQSIRPAAQHLGGWRSSGATAVLGSRGIQVEQTRGSRSARRAKNKVRRF